MSPEEGDRVVENGEDAWTACLYLGKEVVSIDCLLAHMENPHLMGGIVGVMARARAPAYMTCWL